MKVLVFDTETTGFINKKETNLQKQPYIIQFAGIIGEMKEKKITEIRRVNILINPGVPIPYDSSQVHHIYDLDVKDAPSFAEVKDEIMEIINEADVIVWHNIEYDEDMLKLELKRYDEEYKYQPQQVICTMKSSVDFCAIEGNGKRFKYPKLWELHKKLFDHYFLWAHDAMVDVEATLKSFEKLVQNGTIKIEESKNEIMSLF